MHPFLCRLTCSHTSKAPSRAQTPPQNQGWSQLPLLLRETLIIYSFHLTICPGNYTLLVQRDHPYSFLQLLIVCDCAIVYSTNSLWISIRIFPILCITNDVMNDIIAVCFGIARSVSSEIDLEVGCGSKVNAYIIYLGIVRDGCRRAPTSLVAAWTTECIIPFTFHQSDRWEISQCCFNLHFSNYEWNSTSVFILKDIYIGLCMQICICMYNIHTNIKKHASI